MAHERAQGKAPNEDVHHYVLDDIPSLELQDDHPEYATQQDFADDRSAANDLSKLDKNDDLHTRKDE